MYIDMDKENLLSAIKNRGRRETVNIKAKSKTDLMKILELNNVAESACEKLLNVAVSGTPVGNSVNMTALIEKYVEFTLESNNIYTQVLTESLDSEVYEYIINNNIPATIYWANNTISIG